VLLALAAALVDARAAEEKRVALVIGNGNYAHEGRLSNPANDARAVSEALRKVGFDRVDTVVDGDLKAMNSGLAAFARAAENASLALVYYSGHGMEVEGQNYLLPVDAKLADAADVDFEAVSLNLVVRAAERATNVRMVVLDACRNNPFVSRMIVRQGKRSLGRGLAPVAPAAGMLVAYAARAGTVADDGPAGGNSPFTTAFLKHIAQPRVEVRLMMGRIRDEVVRATGNQEPFTYGSLGGDEIFLNAGQGGGAATAGTAPAQVAPVSEAAQSWRLIESMTDPAVFEAFRRQYGAANQMYDQLAASRIAALRRERPVEPPPKPPAAASSSPAKPPGPNKPAQPPAPSKTEVARLDQAPPKPASTPSSADWPSETIRLVVPYAPGGGTDVLGRVLADQLTSDLKRPVIVDNVAGGGGAVGSTAIVKAAPDGSAFLVGTLASHALVPAMQSSAPYAAVDFAPVALVAESTPLLVARKGLGVESLQALLDKSAAASKPLTFASGGIGSISHLACAQGGAAFGITLDHVPYRGVGPALNDIIAGQVDVMCEAYTVLGPQITAGALQPLAVFGPQRLPELPEAPTMRELGYTSAEMTSWIAVFGPKGTPPALVSRLNSAIAVATRKPEVTRRLNELGYSAIEPARASPEYLSRFLRSESAKWKAVAASLGLRN
jgi:tripartite-type tricarboxylate transporter receptor subunit TctC/uncharacterized caspase-like protein